MDFLDKRDFRKRVDLALSRALVDDEYAVGLLTHPAQTLNIQEFGDRSYGSFRELACEAKAVFWD